MIDAKPKILGVNKRYYPMSSVYCRTMGHTHEIDGSHCDDPPVTVAVLVEGDIGDYACYVGHGDPNWVAAWGNKISFQEAQCHFPVGLEKEKYRA